MPEVSLTFRDRLLSVYQSAVADLARQMESDRPPPEAPRDLGSSKAANIVTAAEQAAALRSQGQTDTTFGSTGVQPIPYVRPADVGNYTIPIKAGAKIALFGDWGTGGEPARRILEQMRQQQPDVVVHLGDIYYSGTDSECRSNLKKW